MEKNILYVTIASNTMEKHYNLFLTANISGEIIETAKLSSKQVV